jgi:predicted house-cleaning noncanonical NTP pyrophosphatase (MazG superfamily)
MKTYNKLVRDNIPNIIEKNNQSCETEILNQKEFLLELKKKLIEESIELQSAKSIDEITEELADIYEVLEAIMMEEKIDLFDIQKVRVK